ncbi:MAG: UDP-glucose 4-epimerase GalE [Spirochaetaceae bacterium]|nr:UDP-glucose 4-epimerase GalE [Spirochaetaceae bacterium]
MKILIIGGAGYIGSHVAREFFDAGHKVIVFDNFSSGLRGNIFPEETVIAGDILDYAALVRAMQAGGKVDALVHLAAFKAAGESMLKPEKYSVNNITGTLNILNAAAETGVKHIVFSSSAAVYGSPQYNPIDEAHPKNPENYYGFTKLEIERFLGWYEKLKGIRYAALRYFNAAGYDVKGRITGLEKNPANLIPVVMETAVGKRPLVPVFGNDYDTRDGSCIRDYIHVSDLAAGHAAALDYIVQNDKSLTVNLGSETGLTVLEVIDFAKKITGVNFKTSIEARRPGDPPSLTASAQYARETLGWRAKYSDPETLLKTTWTAYASSVKNN